MLLLIMVMIVIVVVDMRMVMIVIIIVVRHNTELKTANKYPNYNKLICHDFRYKGLKETRRSS